MTTKEQYWKHREKIRDYNREWYQKNKERKQKERREYHKNYPEKSKEDYERNKNKKHKIAWAGRNKNKILIKAKYKCNNCGSIKDLQLHHLEYKNKLEAIQVLCRKCHTQEHVRLRS